MCILKRYCCVEQRCGRVLIKESELKAAEMKLLRGMMEKTRKVRINATYIVVAWFNNTLKTEAHLNTINILCSYIKETVHHFCCKEQLIIFVYRNNSSLF
jgi:hypothetical protein